MKNSITIEIIAPSGVFISSKQQIENCQNIAIRCSSIYSKEIPMETKNEGIRPLYAPHFLEQKHCKKAFEIFIKHFGFYKEVPWTFDNEIWIMNNIEGGIEWLVENGYIKKKSPHGDSVAYTPGKNYVFEESPGSIRALKMIGINRYVWVSFTTVGYTSLEEGTEFDLKTYPSGYDAILHVETNYQVHRMDSLKELAWYILENEH